MAPGPFPARLLHGSTGWPVPARLFQPAGSSCVVAIVANPTRTLVVRAFDGAPDIVWDLRVVAAVGVAGVQGFLVERRASS